jgi:hypothetical protein
MMPQKTKGGGGGGAGAGVDGRLDGLRVIVAAVANGPEVPDG